MLFACFALPNAGQAFYRAGLCFVAFGGLDDALLQEAQERLEVSSSLWQEENGVGYELAGAVVGYVAASFNVDDFDIFFF